METVQKFEEQKTLIINLLSDLKNFLDDGKKYPLSIDEGTIDKVDQSLKEFENKNQKLKVALVGGFSEGKTSIAAGWLGRLDPDSMKISLAESSDQVEFYQTDDDIELVDTPGLFGSGSTADDEKYKEITEKYVSSAQLIIYVMNPNNPIKESHKEELVWLFKDLNLLSRTIFVLGKFDSAVDLEDEEEYEEVRVIKERSINERLHDLGILHGDEYINVVAVSGNPDGEGLNYWMSHLDEYKTLSHIDKLREATTKKIAHLGSYEKIMLENQKSVIQDVLVDKSSEIQDYLESQERIIQRLDNAQEQSEASLKESYRAIKNSQINLLNYFNSLRSSVVADIRGASMEDFQSIYDSSIGADGKVLESNIENQFFQQTDGVSKQIDSQISGYIEEKNDIQEVAGFVAKKGFNLLRNVQFNNNFILKARNVIAPSFKFKPWGAVNLAKGINTALPVIGIVVEGVQDYKEMKREEEFKEARNDIANSVEEVINAYDESVRDTDKFIDKCFPKYREFEKQANSDQEQLLSIKNEFDEFNAWEQRGQALKKRFDVITK